MSAPEYFEVVALVVTAPLVLTQAQTDGLFAVLSGSYGAKVSDKTAPKTAKSEPLVYWKVAESLDRLALIELINGGTWCTVTDAGREVAAALVGLDG